MHRFRSIVMTLFMVGMCAGGLTGQSPITFTPRDTSWTDGPVAVTMKAEPRELSWRLEVPASIERVWQAWTDAQEMSTWAAPGAEVDLQPGGSWEVHFFPDRPKGQRGSDANRIIAIEPGRMLRLAAGAPAEFPTVRREKTEFTVTLQPSSSSEHTVVIATQRGWKTGDEWDRAFVTMAQANATWLGWLYQRFTTGPIDWSKMGFGSQSP